MELLESELRRHRLEVQESEQRRPYEETHAPDACRDTVWPNLEAFPASERTQRVEQGPEPRSAQAVERDRHTAARTQLFAARDAERRRHAATMKKVEPAQKLAHEEARLKLDRAERDHAAEWESHDSAIQRLDYEEADERERHQRTLLLLKTSLVMERQQHWASVQDWASMRQWHPLQWQATVQQVQTAEWRRYEIASNRLSARISNELTGHQAATAKAATEREAELQRSREAVEKLAAAVAAAQRRLQDVRQTGAQAAEWRRHWGVMMQLAWEFLSDVRLHRKSMEHLAVVRGPIPVEGGGLCETAASGPGRDTGVPTLESTAAARAAHAAFMVSLGSPWDWSSTASSSGMFRLTALLSVCRLSQVMGILMKYATTTAM